MKKFNKNSIIISLAIALALGFAAPRITLAVGPAAVDLLSAGNFVILTETGVTNTGSHASVITGNVGSSPITAAAMNNVYCSEITGTIYGVNAAYVGNGNQACFAGNPPLANKTLVDNAVIDMEAAYTNAAGRAAPDGTNLYAGNLGGRTFAPGLYKWTTDVTIPTSMTLSGTASDVWIFQIGGNFSIASGASIPAGIKVLLVGGAKASNIFWQVGGTTGATLGTYSTFNGNILSAKQVIIQTGAVLNGRALAQTQVTLDSNPVSAPSDSAPATLHVIKTVVNNSGGSSVASNFSLHVKLSGTDVAGSPAAGTATPGTLYSLNAGTYVVSENPFAGYSSVFSGDCNAGGSVTLLAGEDKTCTITNDDTAPVVDPATLRVIKTVINDSGRTTTASSFNLHVKFSGTDVAGSPAAGTATPGTSYSLTAGTYVVSEDVNSSYVQSFSGDCDVNGSVTLLAGASKTCTVTNNDIAADIPLPGTSRQRNGTINVINVVINDNGGTKIVDDFLLSVNNTAVNSGETNMFPAFGNVYVVTETNDVNYVRTFSGDCDSDGSMTLNTDDIKFCIITNDDVGAPVALPPVPPLIEVIKVPDPLALPAGPGLVRYTYVLGNIGTVPVTNIRLVGDTCSPIILFSGDNNSDAKLDVNEVWTYRCSKRLLETHTNTVVATGWANGLSAIDIASATVVVGAPTVVVPPLIHLTKFSHPRTLAFGGGIITYIERVSNPGTVALSHIRLRDNKCNSMTYISGDENHDAKLDTTETWKYICRSFLTKTTTNTALVSGQANGFTVRDFAIATVTVATSVPTFNTPPPVVAPKLPNTGFIPAESTLSWLIIAVKTFFKF